MAEPEIFIYYGPPSWFHRELGDVKAKNLMSIVSRMDDERREVHVRVPGEEAVPQKRRRPARVVAESSDFASISHHWIANFARLVRDIRPNRIYLNNPPTRVETQLRHAFKSTKVERYEYPTLSASKLVEFRDGFGDHLVGQGAVRDALLAAMYPLTRSTRTKPVVVMFYGPSGVGKTETANFVNVLLGGELMRKQFSMFHSEKSTAYLFGGEHGEASLARDLLDRESGVILFDEFDKANPVFHSAFYQVFDSGEFVDLNYKVDLGPALIICTTNYRSEEEVARALGEALTSRFDALIPFEALSPSQTEIVIVRLLASILSSLPPDERALVDHYSVLDTLLPLAAKSKNVRRLGKTIEAVVSTYVMDAALETKRRDDRPEDSGASPDRGSNPDADSGAAASAAAPPPALSSSAETSSIARADGGEHDGS